MQRLTISVNSQLATDFDQLIQRKGYRNRSEAFRVLLRKALQDEKISNDDAAQCVACLSYVSSDRLRQSEQRIAEIRQQFCNLTVSSTRAPIDDETYMETLILRGATTLVVRLAEILTGEAGVRHGRLNMVSMNSLRPEADAPPRRTAILSAISVVHPQNPLVNIAEKQERFGELKRKSA